MKIPCHKLWTSIAYFIIGLVPDYYLHHYYTREAAILHEAIDRIFIMGLYMK